MQSKSSLLRAKLSMTDHGHDIIIYGSPLWATLCENLLLASTGHDNNTAQTKADKCLPSAVIVHCLTVV